MHCQCTYNRLFACRSNSRRCIRQIQNQLRQVMNHITSLAVSRAPASAHSLHQHTRKRTRTFHGVRARFSRPAARMYSRAAPQPRPQRCFISPEISLHYAPPPPMFFTAAPEAVDTAISIALQSECNVDVPVQVTLRVNLIPTFSMSLPDFACKSHALISLRL
jgi:hypothetical protein